MRMNLQKIIVGVNYSHIDDGWASWMCGQWSVKR